MARKPQSFKREDVARPPGDERWIWLTKGLLMSPAWRSRSYHCAKLIEFLLIRHMEGSGLDNGDLIAPYDDLVRFGLGRRFISLAIAEAKALRLIDVRHGRRMAIRKLAVSKYRLTFYAFETEDGDGKRYWSAPTDEWKMIDDAAAEEVHAEIARHRSATRKRRAEAKETEPAKSISRVHHG